MLDVWDTPFFWDHLLAALLYGVLNIRGDGIKVYWARNLTNNNGDIVRFEWDNQQLEIYLFQVETSNHSKLHCLSSNPNPSAILVCFNAIDRFWPQMVKVLEVWSLTPQNFSVGEHIVNLQLEVYHWVGNFCNFPKFRIDRNICRKSEKMALFFGGNTQGFP